MSLKEKYQKQIVPALIEKFGYKNKMALPRLEKIVINIGFGREIVDKGSDERKKLFESVSRDLALISGQKPVLTKSKKSISAFNLREGMIIGAKVTLRKDKMYDFLEKVINIALPRARDFWGLDLKAVDQSGNFTLGIKEHTIFPEILPENIKKVLGLEITVVTTAKSREEGLELLKLLGIPFKS